jgi:uncharacterized RDD family membrane protein YckC
MLAQGRTYIVTAWWISLFPLAGLALAIGAFLAIALPIRRVQKQTLATVQAAPPTMDYAGFWVRLASNVIDSLILFLSIVVMVLFINAAMSIFPALGFLLVFIGFGLYLCYIFVFIGGYKDSIGHRLLRIKVVRTNGEPIGLGRSLLRAFFELMFSWGILLLPFNRRKRALYDMLAGTVVVKLASRQTLTSAAEPDQAPPCPQCREPVQPGSQFCMACGAQLAS